MTRTAEILRACEESKVLYRRLDLKQLEERPNHLLILGTQQSKEASSRRSLEIAAGTIPWSYQRWFRVCCGVALGHHVLPYCVVPTGA